jgi:hypothetical protein
MKTLLKFRNYSVLLIIILIILLVSFYYLNFYTNVKYLQDNNLQQILISGLTSIFDGYTETITGPVGSVGSNLFSNIGITIIFLCLFGITESLLKNAKNITKSLFIMLTDEFIFVVIWWPLNHRFQGGLSLWGTFILAMVSIDLFRYAYKRLKVHRKLVANVFISSFGFSIVIYLIYLFVGTNSLIFLILGIILLSLALIVIMLTKMAYGLRDIATAVIASPILAILLALYILPLNNGKILYFNPHIFALALFILSIFIFEKYCPKSKHFKISAISLH